MTEIFQMKNDVAPPIVGSFLKWHLYNIYNLKSFKNFGIKEKALMVWSMVMVWSDKLPVCY